MGYWADHYEVELDIFIVEGICFWEIKHSRPVYQKHLIPYLYFLLNEFLFLVKILKYSIKTKRPYEAISLSTYHSRITFFGENYNFIIINTRIKLSYLEI